MFGSLNKKSVLSGIKEKRKKMTQNLTYTQRIEKEIEENTSYTVTKSVKYKNQKKTSVYGQHKTYKDRDEAFAAYQAELTGAIAGVDILDAKIVVKMDRYYNNKFNATVYSVTLKSSHE